MVPMPILRLLLCCVLLLAAAPAFAQESFHQIRVPVADQSSEARQAALQEAMEQALVRATGRDDAVADPAAAAFVEQPNRFVQLYRYEYTPRGLELAVRIDAAGLRQALGSAGVAVWSADRPPVLVWLAVEQRGERVLVGSDEGEGIGGLLNNAARRRGLLLMFPLLDAEDRNAVGFSDVWGGFAAPVMRASQRYATPVVLIGRVNTDVAGDWRARWQLYVDQREQSWISTGGGLNEALDQGIAGLGERLLALYAGVPSGDSSESLRVQVDGLRGVRDYVRLERYLRDVAGVTQVMPLRLEDGSAAFELRLSAAPDRVQRALTAGGLLRPQEEPRPPRLSGEGVELQPEFRYRLAL